jgi:trans-aconitate methyltransferase
MQWKKLARIYTLLRANPLSSVLTWRESVNQKSLLQQIQKSNLETVGDIGCGSGHSLHHLAAISNKRYAIDSCYDMLCTCKSRYKDVHLICTDAGNSSLQANSFDLLICVGLTEYIPDLNLLFFNLYQSIKPEGYLLITTSPPNFITNVRKLLGPTIYVNNAKKFESLLKDIPFKILDKRSTISQTQYLLQKKINN